MTPLEILSLKKTRKQQTWIEIKKESFLKSRVLGNSRREIERGREKLYCIRRGLNERFGGFFALECGRASGKGSIERHIGFHSFAEHLHPRREAIGSMREETVGFL